MERSFDELQAIGSLVQSLTLQLTESSDHISKLQSIARSLAPKDEYDNLCKKIDNSQVSEEIVDPEEKIIQQLERRRIEIVMDLQRQDYMTEKLQDLIDQNEDIVATVKEYLENKDTIHQEERKQVDQNFNNYVKHVLDPTDDQLAQCLQELQSNVWRVTSMIKSYHQNTTQDFDVLESEKYRNEVNALIKILNKILARENDLNNALGDEK